MTRPMFRELDFRSTPIGDLSLRCRFDMRLGAEVFEIKLGDEFLMSSYFTASEIALAKLGLAEVAAPQLDVVVGGLGLGYTARAALNFDNLASLLVIEKLEAVIEWHRAGLLPLGPELSGDPRCRFVHADFFELAQDAAAGLDPLQPGRRFHAVLLDIDHSPAHLLSPAHAALYSRAGLRVLAQHLLEGGVFALWSNDATDAAFVATLEQAFSAARAETIRFENPLQDREVSQTIYLARR